MANYIEKLHNVPAQIIKSGITYYQEGRISDFHKENEQYFATIQGNAKYNVSLSIKNKELSSFRCDCPYPHLCKHVIALLAKIDAEEKEEDRYVILKRKINSVTFSESLEEFKGLPHKINGSITFLEKNQYTSLMVLYLSNMAKSETLFYDGNLVERFKIFNEKAKLDSLGIKEIISRCVLALKDSLDGTYNFISSFLKDQLTSKDTQEFIVDEYKAGNPSIKYCLTCLSGKALPKYISSPFTLLLKDVSPRLLSVENIINAKNELKNKGNTDDVLSLLHLLLSKGDPSLFSDDDFKYLADNGLNSDARNLAFSILKGSDDFADYLRYRRLFSDKEFYGVRSQVSRSISYKTYLNSVLLIDGREFFPELYTSFTYKNLDPKEVYQAKDFIKEKKDIHILVEIAHKYIKNELGKRNRNKDYFYYLMYLDYLKDDSLSYYLFTKEILIDKESKDYKGMWLYLLERNDCLKRANILSYGKEKACL